MISHNTIFSWYPSSYLAWTNVQFLQVSFKKFKCVGFVGGSLNQFQMFFVNTIFSSLHLLRVQLDNVSTTGSDFKKSLSVCAIWIGCFSKMFTINEAKQWTQDKSSNKSFGVYISLEESISVVSLISFIISNFTGVALCGCLWYRDSWW